MTVHIKVEYTDSGLGREAVITVRDAWAMLPRSIHTLPADMRLEIQAWANEPKRMPWPYADEDLNGVREDKSAGWHESSGR